MQLQVAKSVYQDLSFYLVICASLRVDGCGSPKRQKGGLGYRLRVWQGKLHSSPIHAYI